MRRRAGRPQLKRDPLGGTQPTMQRLPELKPTPLRPRHPLVYGAGFFLFIAFMAFMGRIGMFWVLLATTVAGVVAFWAGAIALRGPLGVPLQTLVSCRGGLVLGEGGILALGGGGRP